jgi:hypothetical protein
MWSARPLSIPAGLFAQWRFDLELFLYGILLVLLIVAGCVAVVRVRRWRNDESASSPLEDQLSRYQDLVERGELDPKEFERIKAHLERKAQEQAALGPQDSEDARAGDEEAGSRSQ